jgi:hypothetical protein
LFLLTSSGVYRQNQVSANFNSKLNRSVSLTGGQQSVNLRVGKTIPFGPELGGSNKSAAGRRYNANVSLSTRNLLNHTNPGPIIGNITSPLFGRANQMAR